MKTKATLAVAILAMTITSTLRADLTGPVYPPLGGVTYSATGSGQNAGEAGGRTLFYTSFNPADFTSLYWTFSSVANPSSTTQTGTIGNMAFASYDSTTGISTWDSTTNMTWATAFGTESVPTTLEIQFQPYTGTNEGLLSSGWLDPTTAGAAGISSLPTNQSVLDVAALGTSNDDYQVWIEYQTAGGTAATQTPLIDYYNNSHHISGGTSTSTSGGFYDDAPEPRVPALLLLGLALAMVVSRSRPAPATARSTR